MSMTAPLELPTLSCDSTSSLKIRTREPATYDWRRQSRQPAAAVWATSIVIVQPGCRQWAERYRSTVKYPACRLYDQYSHYLLSLLTCLRPSSSSLLIAEVQEPSATLPPPASNTDFPSPVLPPGLPCTGAIPMPAQESVLYFLSPASPDALAEHLIDGSKHCARAPAAPYAPSLLETQPPKEAPASLRLDRPIQLSHPHRCHPPSACRAATGHRLRW